MQCTIAFENLPPKDAAARPLPLSGVLRGIPNFSSPSLPRYHLVRKNRPSGYIGDDEFRAEEDKEITGIFSTNGIIISATITLRGLMEGGHHVQAK